MPMVKVQQFLHVGIPVSDLKASTEFYTSVLGLAFGGSEGSGPDSPVRLHCGDAAVPGQQVILFKRPKPFKRDALAEDGSTHHAFIVSPEDFDLGMEQMQEAGIFHRGPITWPGSTHRTLYFFDPDGNYLELADGN